MRTLNVLRCPLRVCLAGEDLDWLGFRCVALAVDLLLVVRLTNDALDGFDRRIFDHVWNALGPPSTLLRPMVSVRGDVPLGSGLSSSSAATLGSVALFSSMIHGTVPARSLCVQIAYEAEYRVTNGGGMDHVSIALGGYTLLQGSSRGLPTVTGRLSPRWMDGLMRFAVIDCNERKASGEHLAAVRDQQRSGAAALAEYCTRVDTVAGRLWEAVEHLDVDGVAEALNDAHITMRDVQGMSTPKMEKVRDLALEAGFSGVKITGSGHGGCLVAVASSEAYPGAVARFRATIPSVDPRTRLFVTRPHDGPSWLRPS